MLGLVLAAVATTGASLPLQPAALTRFVPSSHVSATASVSARIVRPTRIRLGHVDGLENARLRHASLTIEGRQESAYLIEFE